jgi:hypothetical protein
MIPGGRIIHPEFGDMTADIIEELLEMAQFKNPVILEREQAEIAAASGAVARDLSFGRVVAEIHPEAYAEWVAKEGPEFFSKKHGGDGVEYLAKHFPATCVKSVSPHVKLHVNRSAPQPVASSARRRYAVTGRRGRWAA